MYSNTISQIKMEGIVTEQCVVKCLSKLSVIKMPSRDGREIIEIKCVSCGRSKVCVVRYLLRAVKLSESGSTAVHIHVSLSLSRFGSLQSRARICDLHCFKTRSAALASLCAIYCTPAKFPGKMAENTSQPSAVHRQHKCVPCCVTPRHFTVRPECDASEWKPSIKTQMGVLCVGPWFRDFCYENLDVFVHWDY